MSAELTKIKVSKKSFPSIVSYPQGLPSNYEELQIITGKKGDGKSARTVVISEGDSKAVRYRGTDFGENTLSKDSCKFAIGVRNKTTGAMEIIKTDHVFTMKPFVNGENSKVARKSSMSWDERRSGLTEEFGSRKKKRAFEAAKSNTISAENISGASAIETLLGNRSNTGNNALLDAAERAVSAKFGKRSRNT